MKKLVLVETVSSFRHRYVVEVEDDIDHALDEFVMRKGDVNFNEFSQEHLDEIIYAHREITMDEYYKLFDKDNDYLKKWSNEQKLSFINKIDYGDGNDGTNSGNET